MAEFKTPIKNKPVDFNDKITIPPSPFLNRLGYGTGEQRNIFNNCDNFTHLALK